MITNGSKRCANSQPQSLITSGVFSSLTQAEAGFSICVNNQQCCLLNTDHWLLYSMMNSLRIAIPVLAVLLCAIQVSSAVVEDEHSGLREADNHHESHSHEDHHHHGHSHKASAEDLAKLRVGEIVFSIVFCLCVALIIYVIVKRRWA